MEDCVSGELGNSLWWASISLFKDKYSLEQSLLSENIKSCLMN